MSENTETGFGKDGLVSRPVDLAGETEPAMKILSARGTEDGLVLRIDGRAEWGEILSEIRAFLGTRRRFIEGGQVSVEWLERLPTKEQSQELEDHLKSEYGIAISGRRRRPAFTTITVERNAAEKAALEKNARAKDGVVPLFDAMSEELPSSSREDGKSVRSKQEAMALEKSGFGERNSSELGRGSENSRREPPYRAPDPAAVLNIDEFNEGSSSSLSGYTSGNSGMHGAGRGSAYETSPYEVPQSGALRSGKGIVNRIAKILGEEVQYEEDANAKLFFGTLRSGQRIETPFSLIVVGDVNPGADLIAGGDIIVLGSLRGTAHAAAYDDENQDRIIFSLSMQPMQLRIGSVISRGSEEPGGYPEVARVENRRIIVEAFQPRAAFGKKLR